VHGAPDTIDKNEEVIKMTLAAPMAPECWLELIPWSSMAKIRFFTDYRERRQWVAAIGHKQSLKGVNETRGDSVALR